MRRMMDKSSLSLTKPALSDVAPLVTREHSGVSPAKSVLAQLTVRVIHVIVTPVAVDKARQQLNLVEGVLQRAR